MLRRREELASCGGMVRYGTMFVWERKAAAMNGMAWALIGSLAELSVGRWWGEMLEDTHWADDARDEVFSLASLAKLLRERPTFSFFSVL